MNWRIYRLPGSREIWHIDSGPGTRIFNVKKYNCSADSHSVDIGGNNSPRAWIQICSKAELHIINDTALFSMNIQPVEKETAKCAALSE